MPAPKRAILANIHESKLDPTTSYSQLDKKGKFCVSSQEAIKTTEGVFASKQKIISETSQEQTQLAVELKVLIDDIQEVYVEEPVVIESSLEKEVIKTSILNVEELKVSETILVEEAPNKISSTSIDDVDLPKKKFKKKN